MGTAIVIVFGVIAAAALIGAVVVMAAVIYDSYTTWIDAKVERRLREERMRGRE